MRQVMALQCHIQQQTPCITLTSSQAPGRSEEVKAVWSWVQLQLANGLLEYWSTSASESSAQVHIQVVVALNRVFTILIYARQLVLTWWQLAVTQSVISQHHMGCLAQYVYQKLAHAAEFLHMFMMSDRC